MEQSVKRKRIVRRKIELEDSDDDKNEDVDDDDDYAPPTKKCKPIKKEPKSPKPKPLPKTKKTSISRSKKKKEFNIKQDSTKVKEEVDLSTNQQNDNFKIEFKFEVPTANVSNDKNFFPDSQKKCIQNGPSWKDADIIAENCGIAVHTAQNIIQLFNTDATIPFIVRYRRKETGGMQAEKLREVQAAFEEVKAVHKKVETIIKTVKDEKFDLNVTQSLLSAKTMDEVELLYAPFKPGGKRTLCERSRQLGLEPPSLQLLEEKFSLQDLQLHSLIKSQKGLETEKDILSGIQNIISDKISKHRSVLDIVREKMNMSQIRISAAKSVGAEKSDRQAFVEGKTTQNYKYENYFSFNVSQSNIASHQVMALNRGEKEKVLKVKVEVPTFIQKSLQDFMWNFFFGSKHYDKITYDFLKGCIDDSYNRLVEPYMSRQIRSFLTKRAEKDSISVFGSNLRSLLLTPPFRGKVVVGIDPGFSHGCKVGVVSALGEVIDTGVLYPHKNGNITEAQKLQKLILNHSAEIIAIGNGTACRETEVWLSKLIDTKFFYPINVKYCIVNESGASIYSVTKEAEADLPNLDPNIRSAVSIARRLQDPMLEYVKVEPKHLGVGMYQHDVSEAMLKKTLDSIMEECVSFVGVDLNVCPEVVLRRISGLNASRAKAIVDYRKQNGAFVSRQQLREVKGLGPKSFEQCAGFVRILSSTSMGHKDKVKAAAKYTPTPLDTTIIHPESYAVAEKFLKELKINPKDIGQQSATDKVKTYMKFTDAKDISERFSVPIDTMQLIIDALKQLQDYDMRQEFDQPLFRTTVCSFADLQTGQELTGQVRNVTSFGCFVDIGVGHCGLLHTSKMKGRTLNPGDRVTVIVLSVDSTKKRISLALKI